MVNNTLLGIETGVKYGKFRKLRTVLAVYMLCLLRHLFKAGVGGGGYKNKRGLAIGAFYKPLRNIAHGSLLSVL